MFRGGDSELFFRNQYFGSSFFDFLKIEYPHLLPDFSAYLKECQPDSLKSELHGTTILALNYADGSIIAGDRMATEGYQVASRRIEKVFKADEHSAIAIAGAAGPCLEIAKLFQTELEHYEKIEGEELAVEGKANKLAQMIRMNLPAALQGLVVIPIFVGYDTKRREGRIFKYDITGGRYEEDDYYATGSGGKDARAVLKRLFRKGMSLEEAVKVAMEALIEAADEDRGTAGPDLIRGIYPTVKTVTEKGIDDVDEPMIKSICEEIIARRKEK